MSGFKQLQRQSRSVGVRSVLTTAILSAIMAMPVGSIAEEAQIAAKAQAPKAVETLVIQAGKSGATVPIGGSVVPSQQVKLGAQMPGRIQSLAGREGDAFKQGDVMITLDDQELLAKKAAAQAAITAADAAARNAQIQYRRELVSPQSQRATTMPGMGMPGMMDQMFARPMASVMGMEQPGVQRDADLHNSGSQVAQSHASAKQAQAQLKQVEAKLRDAKTLAPFDGVITAKHVEVGDTVQPGMPLLTYADLSQLQVKVDVPARISRKLKAGDAIMVRLDGSDFDTPSSIAQVFPVADAKRHTVTVKVDLPAGVDAAPGMYADVLIPDPDSKAQPKPLVPRTALIWRGSLPGVMLVGKDGAQSLKLIRITDTGDAHHVQVHAGLKPGDVVVANPN